MVVGMYWSALMHDFMLGRSEEVVPLALSSLGRSRAALVLTSASANSALDWSVTFPDCHNDQLGMNSSLLCISVCFFFMFNIVYEKIAQLHIFWLAKTRLLT